MKKILVILIVAIMFGMLTGCVTEEDPEPTKLCWKCDGTTAESKEYPESTPCSNTPYVYNSEPDCVPTTTYLDLTEYEESDYEGIYDVNSNRIKINSAKRSDDSYLRKAIPIGTGYFKLEFDFIAEDPFDQGEIPIPEGNSGTIGGNIGLAFVSSSTTTTIATMMSANDGLYFTFRDWTSNDNEEQPIHHWYGRIDGKTNTEVEDNKEEMELELNTQYHVSIERTGTIATLKLYSMPYNEGDAPLFIKEVTDTTNIQYFLPQICRDSNTGGDKVGSGTFSNFILDY